MVINAIQLQSYSFFRFLANILEKSNHSVGFGTATGLETD
jgi:hypothetical protein